jgi:hypothetical protein
MCTRRPVVELAARKGVTPMSLHTVEALLRSLFILLNYAVFVRRKVVAKRYERVFPKLGALVHQVANLKEQITCLVVAKQVSDAHVVKN